MGTGRRELVIPPRERVLPLTAHPRPSTVVRTASWVPVVTHLVTLLTRVPLGSSLSSGTLSPRITMQSYSIFLPSSPRAGLVPGSPCPHLPVPPSLTAGPAGPGRPSDPGGPWGHKRAESVTLTGGDRQSGVGAGDRVQSRGRRCGGRPP